MDIKNILGGKLAKTPKKRGPKPGQKHSGQFKKGYDPRRNITGRPKLGYTLADRYRDALNEPVDPEKPDYTIGDAIIDVAINRALSGQLDAVQYIEARGFGKIPERVELHTDDGDDIDFSEWDAEDLKNYEILLKKYHQD